MTSQYRNRKKKHFMDSMIRRLEKFLSKYRSLTWLYTCFFQKMTIDEFEMVNLPKGSRVINVGCGSLPHTLLILARVKDWDFVGIDRDKDAVEKAKKVVDHYGRSSRIKIHCGNGLDFDISSFDLIIFSHGVEPKLEVLKVLGDKMSPSSMILYRTTWDTLDKVYGEEPIPSNLMVKDSYDRIDGIKAFLLVKGENNK